MTLIERAAMPVTGLSAGVFAVLSALRRKRVFHPIGVAFTGRLRFNEAAEGWLPEALTDPKEHDVVTRFSRGAGLPGPLPDVLGISIKIPGVCADGGDQDWLLASSGHDPITRHALIPSFDFLSRPYSTVLPYQCAGRLVTFGAFPLDSRSARTFDDLNALVRDDQVSFDFTIASQGERHLTIGTLELSQPETAEVSRRLRFNPWNSCQGLRPAGALNQLRRDAYTASQTARPDT